MDLVVNFRNFKVRINAALAFSVPEERNHYNEYYFPILKSLFNALDNSQHMEDYNEFKHRDNLVDQVSSIILSKEKIIHSAFFTDLHLYCTSHNVLDKRRSEHVSRNTNLSQRCFENTNESSAP